MIELSLFGLMLYGIVCVGLWELGCYLGRKWSKTDEEYERQVLDSCARNCK